MSRPELQAPPEIVCLCVPLASQTFLICTYSTMETPKRRNILRSTYRLDAVIACQSIMCLCSTRIQQIQSDMTYRALELLSLPPDESKFILDIGCGSGLSGEILEEEGHYWVGVDIAPSMLGECECFWTSHRGKLSSWVILLQRLRWREK